MTRTMIDANKYIFLQLKEFVVENNISIPLFEGRRHISSDLNEKNWLQNLVVSQSYQILPNLKTAKFGFQGREYFLIVGWEKPALPDPTLLTPFNLNAGIVTALLYELKIPIRRNTDAYDVANTIFHQTIADDNRPETIVNWAYDFQHILKYFEPIVLYELPLTSNLINQDIIKISGFYLSKNKNKLFLSFSDQTINTFEKIFIEGASKIPYENLLNSLTTVHWQYAFLDIYRCIERLFPIHALEQVHSQSGATVSLFDFAIKIEELIGWKPKEDDVINKLFDDRGLLSKVETLLRDVKKHLDGDETGELGKRFYKIRNSIVHYRPATSMLNLDNEHWNKLIEAALLIVDYWYKKYDTKLV